jgi:ribonuclease H2 subunit C
MLMIPPATQHVHFRGRHLHGISVPLPSNYTGAVLNITDKTLSTSINTSSSKARQEDDDEDDDAEMEEDVKIADEVGTFDEIVIWEHGGKVDVENSAFVRGLGEWIGFAEGMHCDGDEQVQGKEEAEKKA